MHIVFYILPFPKSFIMKNKVVAAALMVILCNTVGWSQVKNDTISPTVKDLTFTGTRINPYDAETDTSGKIEFSGYVDAYYACYTDTASVSTFQKFPTIAPRSNSFGLNIAQASARYSSPRFRGVITVFAGDVARSAWSPEFSFIQEANAGFRIGKKVWIDAGFFRTHLGLESIQPRENITLSIATTTYFEPYYLSGAKLTWELNSKLTLQANVFNSFNGFVENNRNKALGFSMAWQPIKGLSFTYGNILCEETPGELYGKKTRFYNNLFAVYKRRRITLGAEVNYGTQNHTGINDSQHLAYMFSSLLAFKYRLTPQLALYTRGEYFADPDEMLTGPVQNEYHQLVGLRVGGITQGIEYKPIPNSYLRLEGRWLDARKDEHIFLLRNAPSHNRYELLGGLGLWF